MGHSSDSCIKAGPLASITIGSELGGLTGSSSTSGITVWRSKSEALVGCRETGSDWECGKIDNSSGKKSMKESISILVQFSAIYF